jgi:parallel beta-helix repeat protein
MISKMKYRFLLSLLLSLLSHPLTATAATYYVTKTGNNNNPCTQTAPCLTIGRGVSKAVLPGDTVIVGAGTYVESVANWSSGIKGSAISVKANSGDTVIWHAPSTDLNELAGAILINGRSYVRIEGFRFENSVTKTTIRVVGPVNAKDNGSNVVGIEIVNNSFVNNGNNAIENGGNNSRTIYLQSIGYGSSYAGAPVNIISGNQFNGNYGSDIWLLESSDTQIVGNVSINLRGSQGKYNGYSFMARSIHLGGGSKRNIIERNTISSMTKDAYVTASYDAGGLRLDTGANNNVFQDNIIHDLDFAGAAISDGIYAESSCNYNLFQRNIIYNIGQRGMHDGAPPTSTAVGNNWINNVVFNCKGGGLILSNSKNTIVKNNILANNGADQIAVSSISVSNGGHVFRNNDYFKAGNANIGYWSRPTGSSSAANLTLEQWSSVSGDKNSLSVDPGLVNPPLDFHLKSTSLVKGKGESGVDMGAYPSSVQSPLSMPTGLRIVD